MSFLRPVNTGFVRTEESYMIGSHEAATAAAATVFDFEKALAEASLDNVALRDPRTTDQGASIDVRYPN